MVFVRKWNPQEERLVSVSEDEEERYNQAVKALEFDMHLGPYDLSHYGDWKRLSNYITKSIIERLEPIGGKITVTRESAMYENCLKTAMEKALDEQLRNNKFTDNTGKFHKSGCYYTSIPPVVKCKGIQGRQLTSLNLDKTDHLETLLEKEYGGSEEAVLGEMQFAFVAFLMGQSLEGFIQWNSLVSLLFGCIEAVNKSVGPFDALFCVGQFFSDSPERLDEFTEYMEGRAKFPLPTYFIGDYGVGAPKVLLAASRNSANLGFEMDGFKICENLFWLKGNGKFNFHCRRSTEVLSKLACSDLKFLKRENFFLSPFQFELGMQFWSSIQGIFPHLQA